MRNQITRPVRTLALALAFLCAAGTAGGCGGGVPIVSEVKETVGYPDPQTMLVIITERNRYRKIYTDQIWQVQINDEGTTFQEYLLGEVQRFLRELKTMNLLADEQGLTLTSQEQELLRQLSDQFYQTLTDADREKTGAGREDIYAMYEAYHRANRLVDELTKEVNLEISDSEARVITVQEIRLHEEAQAEEVYAQVTAEGADFASIARSVSEGETVELSVGRSERSRAYDDAVFTLETGQISRVFANDGAWYIVKCISDYDEAATLERKQKLALQRKNQAFRQIYDVFAEKHPVEIRGSIWDEISLADGAESTTTDFFERYQEFMNQ